MSKAADVFKNVLKESELSTTIGIMGPSGSGKSTTQSLVLEKTSNRTLSGNIGDIAQTSLIDTIIGLTTELDKDEVCIQCVSKKYGTDFQDAVLEVVWKKMYDMRDELEEISVDDELIKSILNPANKSYHAYEFIISNKIDAVGLVNVVEKLIKNIAEYPEDINDAVDAEFKERKKIDKKPVKKQVFQKIVMERFFNNEEDLKDLENWYSRLIEQINAFYDKYWNVPNEYIVYGNLSDNTKIEMFLKDVYAKESAFSMAFKSLRYVVRPNEAFINAYKEKYGLEGKENFKMSLNILDTIGLTQIGDTKEIIDNAIEEILCKKAEAYLFLCAADVKPTVYQYCMEALSDHSKRIENVPFTLCRTKADVVLRNKMSNISRNENGSNIIEEEKYADYLEKAFTAFDEELLKKYEYGEDKLGQNKDNDNESIEYVSMAPDLYGNMTKAIRKLNSDNHIIQVILNLFYAVDKKYIEENILRVKSKNSLQEPITIVMSNAYFDSLAAAMVLANKNGNKQYLKYKEGNYHGYSITCFFRKHSRGVGHETYAHVYDNFKLHIKSIIRGWITRQMIDNGNKSCHFNYDNVFMVNQVDMIPFMNEFEDRFFKLLEIDIVNIIDRVAKKLSFDCFEERFWQCYSWKSRQTGFVENLNLFDSLFGSQEYWKTNLVEAFKDEYLRILSRMCDYVVES